MSVRICSCRKRKVLASVPDQHDQHILKALFKIWNFYANAEHTHKKLMLLLRVHISAWCICSVNASVPDLYAQGAHQFLQIRLSIRVKNFEAPKEPLNNFLHLILTPQSPSRRDLIVEKSLKSERSKISHMDSFKDPGIFKLTWNLGDAKSWWLNSVSTSLISGLIIR
jgi:hypothetical protein